MTDARPGAHAVVLDAMAAIPATVETCSHPSRARLARRILDPVDRPPPAGPTAPKHPGSGGAGPSRGDAPTGTDGRTRGWPGWRAPDLLGTGPEPPDDGESGCVVEEERRPMETSRAAVQVQHLALRPGPRGDALLSIATRALPPAVETGGAELEQGRVAESRKLLAEHHQAERVEGARSESEVSPSSALRAPSPAGRRRWRSSMPRPVRAPSSALRATSPDGRRRRWSSMPGPARPAAAGRGCPKGG